MWISRLPFMINILIFLWRFSLPINIMIYLIRWSFCHCICFSKIFNINSSFSIFIFPFPYVLLRIFDSFAFIGFNFPSLRFKEQWNIYAVLDLSFLKVSFLTTTKDAFPQTNFLNTETFLSPYSILLKRLTSYLNRLFCFYLT